MHTPKSSSARYGLRIHSPSPSAKRSNAGISACDFIPRIGVLVLFFSFCLLGSFLPLALHGQESTVGTIEGRVLSSASNSYLENVSVNIDGTTRKTVTGSDGTYRFYDVPAGDVTIRAIYVGMEEKAEQVTVSPGKTVECNIELRATILDRLMAKDDKDVVKLEPITVVGTREFDAQALSMNERRTAPNIKNVVSFDEFSTVSDGNVGEFLKFIPGVTLAYSGIVAAEISVRGFPGAATAVTINGSELATGSYVQSRMNLAFGIPVNNISRIEVTKVPTPDMPASGLGGNINIISKSGFQQKERLFSYSIYSAVNLNPNQSYAISTQAVRGFQPKLQASRIQPSIDLNYTMPINEKFAVSLSGSRLRNYYQAEFTTPEWNLDTLVQTRSGYNVNPEIVTQTNWRVGADWKVGANDMIQVSMQRRLRESLAGTPVLQLNYGSGATGGETFTQGTAAGVGSATLSGGSYSLENSTRLAEFHYTHDGKVWKINADASRSSGNTFLGDGLKGTLFGVSSTLPDLIIRGDGIGSTSKDIGSLVPASVTAVNRSGQPVDVFNGNNYGLSSITVLARNFESNYDSAKVNFSREFATRIPFTLKTGLSVQRQKWDAHFQQDVYAFRPTATFNDRLVENYRLVDPGYSNSPTLPKFAGRRVQWISPSRVYELFRDHPDYFVLNETNSHTVAVNNSKKLEETVSAAFLRGDVKLAHDKLWIVAGVRYERTDDEGYGPLSDPRLRFVMDANGNFVLDSAGNRIRITTNSLENLKLYLLERAAHVKNSYGDFYPSLNARYEIRERIIARFGYARTIGRPNLTLIMPGVTITEPSSSGGTGRVTVINTGLTPWTADNYDLSLESYQFKDGFGSIGVFHKEIKNFFVSSAFPATAELLEKYGAPTELTTNYEIRTQGNGGDATISGMEIGYRQSLTFLPDWARGLQVYANYTKLKLSGSTTADFSGFNPESYNWGINLIRPRYFVKFSMQYQGETRRAASGTTGTYTVYNYSRGFKRDTLSAEYRFKRGFGVFIDVKDFLSGRGFQDEQLRYAENTPDYAKHQRLMDWGVSVTVGIKGEF